MDMSMNPLVARAAQPQLQIPADTLARLKEAFDTFVQQQDGVQAAVLATVDGFEIASHSRKPSLSVENLAASLGVKRVGASSLAVAGAALGTLAGLMAGLIGVLIGPIIGAVIGEWMARRDGVQASKAGLAAGISFLLGIVAKVGIAFMMIGVLAVAWLV